MTAVSKPIVVGSVLFPSTKTKSTTIESETKLSDDVNDAKNAGLKPQSYLILKRQ